MPRQEQEQMSLDDRTVGSGLAVEILSLVNEISIKIFMACEKGIESSTKTIKELGLTQKQYYTWLKRLLDVGLVEKRGNIYGQTTLGKYVYKLWDSLLSVLNQRDHLELADKLMQSRTFSPEEKERVLQAISQSDMFGAVRLMDVIHEVKMIDDYDCLIGRVIELVDSAKESVHIAAHRADPRVADAMISAIERGVKFFFLSSEEKQFSERMQAFKMILNPELVKTMRSVLDSREINIRVAKLSYSFCVTDGKYGIIELPHPAHPDFYVGFEFKNEAFCQKLIETFDSLYEKGKTNPLLEFVRKHGSYYK